MQKRRAQLEELQLCAAIVTEQLAIEGFPAQAAVGRSGMPREDTQLENRERIALSKSDAVRYGPTR